MSMFQKAVKEQAKLRLAIAGPSGSGKTFTALKVATAMGGRVALVDTEHGSASKYADLFAFDVLELEAPFHPARFVEAIQDATRAGYDILIIDSLSHAWNGPGGVLEIVEQASKKFRGNSYAGWQEGTPAHNSLIEGIVSAGLHIIGTMRSKQEYVLMERNGKQVPQKVGMAPVQRDGFEYEFDIYLDMDIENNAIVSKTRCPALTGKVLPKPGEDLADILAEWLHGVPANDGKPFDTSVAKSIRWYESAGHVELTRGLLGIDYPQSKNEAADYKVLLAEYAELRANGIGEEEAIDMLSGEENTGPEPVAVDKPLFDDEPELTGAYIED